MSRILRFKLDDGIIETEYHSYTIVDDTYMLVHTSDYDMLLLLSSGKRIFDLENAINTNKPIKPDRLPIDALSIYKQRNRYVG